MTKIEQLLNQLTSIDVEKGNPGKITKNELISGIQAVLPNVDEESMAALVKGAELELDAQNAEEIDYKEMFKEVNAWTACQSGYRNMASISEKDFKDFKCMFTPNK